MPNNDTVFNYENVNGFILSLTVDRRTGSPNSRRFTVSYKSSDKESFWPKISLLFSIIFNVLALSYVRISLTAVLIIIIVLSFLIYFWITHNVQSESLLVIPTVGIQSTVKYVCGREDSFVPWSHIDDVIINEVIKMNRVLYYLTILVKPGVQSAEADSTKLIPLFKHTNPRLMMLERIYSELQTVLMDAQREDSTMGSGDVG